MNEPNDDKRASVESVVMPMLGNCDFVGTRHTIRTIEDLQAIPSEKIEHCLSDIALAILTHRATVELSGVACLPLSEIEWVDDGKHGIAIKIAAT